MEYLKPTLATLGTATSVILGDDIDLVDDSSVGDSGDFQKPPDIAAGLDD